MAAYRWTLDNTVSGQLVIGDPVNWEDTKLVLERDERYHGVFENFSLEEIKVTCGNGKEYIDNIYETQGIDALITLLIEFDCDDTGFETLLDGKINLATYETGFENKVGEITSVKVERNDITQAFRNRSKVKVNINSLVTLDGTAMNAYAFAPFNMTWGSQAISLESELDGGAFLAAGGTFAMPGAPITFNAWMQDALPVITDDLETVHENIDYITAGLGLALNSTALTPNYDSSENNVIKYPETYNVAYDFTGDWTDCANVASTRNAVTSIQLVLYYGPDLNTVNSIVIGALGGPGYPTAALCGAPLVMPFNFVGNQNITVNKGDKFWLAWEVLGYAQTAGGAVNITFQTDYDTSEIIYTVTSLQANQSIATSLIYEDWARVSESITDQPSFAFKSDYFGRTDAEPNAGGAPVYGVDGCGSLMAVASGLALRGYGKKILNVPLPDFASLDDLFDTCNAIYNIGLSLEVHGANDVIRVEDKAFFYSNVSIIQLTNVQNLKVRVDESRFINEFEVGYAKWEPSNFDGLDEICTKHEYQLPVKTVKNRLVAISPYIASGYAIEIVKRRTKTQKEDLPYDDNNFVVRLKRQLSTFIRETSDDYVAVNNIDNITSRFNLKISPKRNFLRWLNVLGAGIEKNAGELIRFSYGEGNYIMTSRIDVLSGYVCDGFYNSQLLDEAGDIAWDDANASLNVPLWIPEIWEFDFPLTFAQYQTIRATPNGYIEFSTGSVTFIRGFILSVEYLIKGGLSHFKLLRKFD